MDQVPGTKQTSPSVAIWMYRAPHEYIALTFSVGLLLLFGWLFSLINIYLFMFVFIVGVIYVQLHQAQYLGNAMRIHEGQLPEMFQLFRTHATTLGISTAALYIRQDPYMNAYTLGINKCTVVLTSALVEHLTENELSFVIAHELGHYKAWHTKISTILIPIGINNIFFNFIFGFWSRKAEYTSDRCALVLTKNIDAGISSLIKLAVGGPLYKNIDIQGYVAQVKTAQSGMVRLSELLESHPLITNRIKQLLKFWNTSFTKIAD